MAGREPRDSPRFRFSLAELMSVLLIITLMQGLLTVALGWATGDWLIRTGEGQAWLTFLCAPSGLLGAYVGVRMAQDAGVRPGRSRLVYVSAGTALAMSLGWVPVFVEWMAG